MDLSSLHAEFPRNAVSWRAQSLSRAGDKALALAYIDARDVMRRLDEVCGPAGWEDSYVETPKGRLICTIRLRIGDEWVSKSDGAGDTDVEGSKGAISDSFKRAAVKWGIGRYLYDIESPWVPCETYDRNGKKAWSRWTAEPWSCVRNAPVSPIPPATIAAESEISKELRRTLRDCTSEQECKAWLKKQIDAVNALDESERIALEDEYKRAKAHFAEVSKLAA